MEKTLPHLTSGVRFGIHERQELGLRALSPPTLGTSTMSLGSAVPPADAKACLVVTATLPKVRSAVVLAVFHLSLEARALGIPLSTTTLYYAFLCRSINLLVDKPPAPQRAGCHMWPCTRTAANFKLASPAAVAGAHHILNHAYIVWPRSAPGRRTSCISLHVAVTPTSLDL